VVLFSGGRPFFHGIYVDKSNLSTRKDGQSYRNPDVCAPKPETNMARQSIGSNYARLLIIPSYSVSDRNYFQHLIGISSIAKCPYPFSRSAGGTNVRCRPCWIAGIRSIPSRHAGKQNIGLHNFYTSIYRSLRLSIYDRDQLRYFVDTCGHFVWYFSTVTGGYSLPDQTFEQGKNSYHHYLIRYKERNSQGGK